MIARPRYGGGCRLIIRVVGIGQQRPLVSMSKKAKG
jgi:hypothetical protein